jgi:shikimate 5-dehydrogenase
MLLHQGLEQIRLMTGQTVTAEQIRPALLNAAAQR